MIGPKGTGHDRQRLVVVLGMHRSGTSAITRGLKVLGVDLGDGLQGAESGVNDKGFWEDIEIHDLDVDMLEALGRDWGHVSAIGKDQLRALHEQDYFPRAVALLRRKADHVPVFGFKDPRLAMLLPFWQEVFEYLELDVAYVIAIRNPLSVARSLKKRDRMEAEQAYLLWLGHVVTPLAGTLGSRRVLVDFDCLMRSPDSVLKRMGEGLDLAVDEAELDCYRNDFLDPRSRHTVFDLDDLHSDAACPSLVAEVYGALHGLADGSRLDDMARGDDVARWFSEFSRLEPALRLVDKLLIKHRATERVIGARDEALVRLQAHIDDDIHRSVSWRVTAPLRLAGQSFKYLHGLFGRGSAGACGSVEADSPGAVPALGEPGNSTSVPLPATDGSEIASTESIRNLPA